MTTQEMATTIKLVHLKDQTAVTGATLTTDALDTLGWNSAGIAIDVSVWAGATSTWTPKLQESDTTTSGDFTDVALANVKWYKSGVVDDTLTDANGPVVKDTDTDQCTILGMYIAGSKRYIRMVVTLANSPTTMVMVPVGILMNPQETYGEVYTNYAHATS